MEENHTQTAKPTATTRGTRRETPPTHRNTTPRANQEAHRGDLNRSRERWEVAGRGGKGPAPPPLGGPLCPPAARAGSRGAGRVLAQIACSPSKAQSTAIACWTGTPLTAGPAPPIDAREHEYVLTQVDDLLYLGVILLPHLRHLSPHLSHPGNALVDPSRYSGRHSNSGERCSLRERFDRHAIARGPGLEEPTDQLDLLLRHRPVSIPLHPRAGAATLAPPDVRRG